jgi:long-subunit fatty acid transport protein
LPFHISFIANIARKRPELKQGKTRGSYYALNTGTDTGFGYLLGVSFIVPERGARVTLTYNSPVKHSFDSTEFGLTAFGPTELKLP